MKNKPPKTVKVNFEGQETTVEVLADSIKQISDGMKKLQAGRLNDKALYLLIQHATKSPYRSGVKVGITEIKNVIDGIKNLERAHLK